jgi:hypothetical protein
LDSMLAGQPEGSASACPVVRLTSQEVRQQLLLLTDGLLGTGEVVTWQREEASRADARVNSGVCVSMWGRACKAGRGDEAVCGVGGTPLPYR